MTGIELAVIMPYIAAAGTAVSAIGAISTANAARKSGDVNAAIGEANAVGARNAAAENAKRVERQGRQRMGELRNSGLLMDVIEDQAREEQLAVLNETYKGELQALGLERGASISRTEGRNAQKAGYASATALLVEGGSTLYGSGAFDSTGPSNYTTRDALSAGYGKGI